jgi:FixJ family two-component response regulator
LLERAIISIVDDDQYVREALARLIRSHGFRTQMFDSAEALLGLAAPARGDCLIVDVQMPGMTGLELHNHLGAAGERIPTILITAHPDPIARDSAFAAGVSCYLAKPCAEDELIDCIRRAIEPA